MVADSTITGNRGAAFHKATVEHQRHRHDIQTTMCLGTEHQTQNEIWREMFAFKLILVCVVKLVETTRGARASFLAFPTATMT
jgi:hypothetical protein